MDIQTRLIRIGISMLFMAGLAACDRNGPTPSTDQKIDQVVDTISQKIDAASQAVGEKRDRQSARAGDVIDDAEVTTRVKAAIFSAPGLKSLKINVETSKGVVTLRGSTDSLSSSDRATMLAGTVAGVEEVKNRLVVVN